MSSSDFETVVDIKFLNTGGEHVTMKTHPRFKNYRALFKNLLKQSDIELLHPIITMLISKDSTRTLSLSRKDETTWFIQQHDLESQEEMFKEMIGGSQNDFIKCKDIIQNSQGNLFALPYNNDGVFKIRIFGRENRS